MKKMHEIREKANSKWDQIQSNAEPIIFIGAGSCGLAAGAGETWKAIEGFLVRYGIRAKIVPVGCIGPCYLEPLVDIKMPNSPRVSYYNVTSDVVERILKPIFKEVEYAFNIISKSNNIMERKKSTFERKLPKMMS